MTKSTREREGLTLFYDYKSSFRKAPEEHKQGKNLVTVTD